MLPKSKERTYIELIRQEDKAARHKEQHMTPPVQTASEEHKRLSWIYRQASHSTSTRHSSSNTALTETCMQHQLVGAFVIELQLISIIF